jgi:hypothetical protein
MPTPRFKFGLITKSRHISIKDLSAMTPALNRHQNECVLPFWGRFCVFQVFDHEKNMPVGWQPCFIQDRLNNPGALGYHETDIRGQPVLFVSAQGGNVQGVCKTISHEGPEGGVDSSGNRLVPVPDPEDPTQTAQMLIEVCDPTEALDLVIDGWPMSDFYFPEWLDAVAENGRRYTYLDALKEPRTLLRGGYFSYIGADGKWRQKTWFNGSAPITEGPFNWEKKPGESLRQMVDRETSLRRAA